MIREEGAAAIFNAMQERPVNLAISNAFGFGGHNTSVAFSTFDG